MGDQVLVYVVTTESGDEYVFVFNTEPSKEYFADVLKRDLGEEAEFVSGVREYWEQIHG